MPHTTRVPIASLLAVALAGLGYAVRADAQTTNTCASGQTITADTAGHCCWPNQAWSNSRQACVGLPACPNGLTAQGESCAMVCAPGQSVSADTAGHCCWPAQAWSNARQVCVGIPQCPAGFAPQGEGCAPATAAPPTAPPTAPVVPYTPPNAYAPAPAYPAPIMSAGPEANLRINEEVGDMVSVDTPTGTRECTTPCILSAPVGATNITVRNANRHFSRQVMLHPGDNVARVRLRRDLGFPLTMLIGGAVLGITGVVLVEATGNPVFWALEAGAGVAVIVGGIGLATMGRNEISVNGEAHAVLGRPRFAVAPLVGGGAFASLALTF